MLVTLMVNPAPKGAKMSVIRPVVKVTLCGEDAAEFVKAGTATSTVWEIVGISIAVLTGKIVFLIEQHFKLCRSCSNESFF